MFEQSREPLLCAWPVVCYVIPSVGEQKCRHDFGNDNTVAKQLVDLCLESMGCCSN